MECGLHQEEMPLDGNMTGMLRMHLHDLVSDGVEHAIRSHVA